MNYYNRHLGDYAKDTGHLSLLEHGVYTRLLDWSYATERPLPADEESIYRLCGALKKPEQEAVRRVIGEFFQVTGGGRVNKRVMEELGQAKRKSENNRKGGLARHGLLPEEAAEGQPDGSERSANAGETLEPDGSERSANGQPRARASITPITNSQEPIDTHTHGGGGKAEADGGVPTWEDVRGVAELRGVAEESARRFFDHHQGNQLWINQHGRLIDWRHKLHSWSVRDAASRGVASSPGGAGGGGAEKTGAKKVGATTQMIELRRQEKVLREEMDAIYTNEGMSPEWRGKREEMRELQRQMAGL